MKSSIKMLGLLAVFFFSTSLSAQEYYVDFDRQGHTLVGSSLGFATIGSTTGFLTDLEADYFVSHNISVGGQMLFRVGNAFIWAPQAVGKFTFDIDSGPEWARQIKPHGEILVGFATVSNGGSDAGLLAGFGFGGDYFVNSRFAVGSDLQFQFSDDLAGQNFLFAFKVVNFKYLF